MAGDVVVAFDWNGTVVDDTDRAVDATNALLRRAGGQPLDRATFVASFTLPLDGWLSGLGLGGRREEWNAELCARPARLRAGAAGMLAELRGRGALLAVVSAAGREAVTADLEHVGLWPAFDRVATAVDDKAAHLSALRRTCAAVVYVGDTEFDVRSARAAGCPSLAILGGWQPPEALHRAGATAVLACLGDVPETLRSLGCIA